MSLEALWELKDLTNQAIKKACESNLSEPLSKDAVNWADLQCVEVRQSYGDDGDVRYDILIAEASPDGSENLKNFVRTFLETHGFDQNEICIFTEW